MNHRNQIILSIITALSFIAMCGSLYFSLGLGLAVCDLCWYQRICMYPIWFISLIALLTNNKKVHYQVRGLSLIGIIIASYHVYIQFFSGHSPFCRVDNPCSEIQLQYFGFLTIPVMSLTVFILIFICTFFIKKEIRRYMPERIKKV